MGELVDIQGELATKAPVYMVRMESEQLDSACCSVPLLFGWRQRKGRGPGTFNHCASFFPSLPAPLC